MKVNSSPTPFLRFLALAMANREAVIQEFHNSEDHRNLMLREGVQSTGTAIPSGCSTYGRVEKVGVPALI